ncbi:hypothetical protein BDK51DRAFT_46699, partial [Blyttiomyces helicus]
VRNEGESVQVEAVERALDRAAQLAVEDLLSECGPPAQSDGDADGEKRDDVVDELDWKRAGRVWERLEGWFDGRVVAGGGRRNGEVEIVGEEGTRHAERRDALCCDLQVFPRHTISCLILSEEPLNPAMTEPDKTAQMLPEAPATHRPDEEMAEAEPTTEAPAEPPATTLSNPASPGQPQNETEADLDADAPAPSPKRRKKDEIINFDDDMSEYGDAGDDQILAEMELDVKPEPGGGAKETSAAVLALPKVISNAG